jgi:hypothetical protein
MGQSPDSASPNGWSNSSLWNWKSAVLSMMLRLPVFAIATMRRGADVILAAVLTEAVVCSFYAGCYAAVVQAIRNRKPVWLMAVIIGFGLPALGQVIEYEVHSLRGTPHTTAAVIASSILAALASLFNWYAMKRGTMLVGGEGGSFAADLRQLPLLLGRFFLLGPRWVLRQVGRPAVSSD